MWKSKQLVIFAAAAGLGATAFALTTLYARPEPAPGQPHAGMTTTTDSVVLADSAAQWSAIEVAPAAPPAPHWTDAMPARIGFDETRASRVGSPLGGRIARVAVERGQHVKLGDPLFTVASPNLAELRSDRDKATVELATAKIDFDRIQALVDGQALPGKELVAARQQVAEAELALRLADEKLASLRVKTTDDSQFTVVAPRDGVVVELAVAPGQEVDASNGTLVAIADLSSVWVVADVFETDLGGIREGGSAKVALAGDTAGDELTGTIASVSAVVDPDRHTIPVRVKLANPGGALRPNAHAQVRFLDATPAAAEVPASAVISDGVGSYVYVRDGGRLRRRDVEVAAVRAGTATLRTGVAPGEAIVVHGATLLDNQIQLDH